MSKPTIMFIVSSEAYYKISQDDLAKEVLESMAGSSVGQMADFLSKELVRYMTYMT